MIQQLVKLGRAFRFRKEFAGDGSNPQLTLTSRALGRPVLTAGREEMIMTLIYPNIVPENDLRLPDALTVKHGPARLLSRFVLEGDKAARGMGLRLRLRHDFGELLYLNEREVAHGNWFKLVNMYNPAYCDLSPENSYWISGENEE
ncbi:MAG TPA: hypothetical protein VJ349_25575, partial [Stellaceae bacterium]|nr:hypothetical protein [Stellaceae bacterium]